MIAGEAGVALVSGGTGFVGSHVVRRLAHRGFDVHVLCREQSDFWRIKDVIDSVHCHVAPLEDLDRLTTVVHRIRPSQIFHLAAATVVAGSAAAAADLVRVNLLGTVNLFEACEQIDYQALITTGDSFEYSNSMEPLVESSLCEPVSLHGISKLAATLYAKSVAASRGRPTLTVRLFSTYGTHDHPKRLVPVVIRKALANEAIELSRPDIRRDWVHIDDVTSLYLMAAEQAHRHRGQIFNAGSGVATDLDTVVSTILRLTHSSSKPLWGVFSAPPHDDYPWVASQAHTLGRLGWKPKISLEEGLMSIIETMK